MIFPHIRQCVLRTTLVKKFVRFYRLFIQHLSIFQILQVTDFLQLWATNSSH